LLGNFLTATIISNALSPIPVAISPSVSGQINIATAHNGAFVPAIGVILSNAGASETRAVFAVGTFAASGITVSVPIYVGRSGGLVSTHPGSGCTIQYMGTASIEGTIEPAVLYMPNVGSPHGSGSLGAASINSGEISSGQIGGIHLSSGCVQSGHVISGNIITYSRSVVDDTFNAMENISGVRCVQIQGSGFARIAMAAVSGRMPAYGVAFTNALSGESVSIVMAGTVRVPTAEISSGVAASGRWMSRLWVGASGQLVTISGGGPTIGIGPTNSGAMGQLIGSTTGSGRVIIDMDATMLSGEAVITTNSQFWPL
jgi:hypothetical protein